MQTDEIKIDFGAYDEIQSLKIAGVTLFMGWNPNDPAHTYLVYNRHSIDLGDYCTDAVVSNDYLEIVQLYAERLQAQIEKAKEYRKGRGLPNQMLGKEHCRPRGEKESLVGSLIILNPESLTPEYRTADGQLVIATGGFGCEPSARGRAVFVKELYSGKEFRVNIGDVLGIADYNTLPDWIDGKLLERQKEADSKEKQFSKRKTHGGDAR